MTTPGTRPTRWRDALTLLAATLMGSSAALYNRYPLVYSDTGAYLGIPRLGDRSIFYGLFLAPARLTHTLWSAVFAQSLLVVFLLRLLLREVFAIRSRLEFLAAVALLVLLTSLPWYAGDLMPDIFTPLMVLGLFMLAFCFERLGRWEQYLVGALTVVAVIVHFSHIPIALGLLAIGALIRWCAQYSHIAVPRLGLPTALIAASLVALVASNYLMFGLATVSPGGYAFVLARLVENGPAVKYLRENCPSHSYAACAFLDRMPMSTSHLLWSKGSLFSNGGFIKKRRESRELVLRTIKDYPVSVLRDAMVDTFRQFQRNRTGDGLSSFANAYNPTEPLRSRYPGDFDAYINSRQQRGELVHMRSVAQLDSYVLLFSVFYCSFVGILLAVDRQWLPVEFMITSAVAIFLHAFVMGALSNPESRYGSRIIWLIPLIAIASWRHALGLSGADHSQPPASSVHST